MLGTVSRFWAVCTYHSSKSQMPQVSEHCWFSRFCFCFFFLMAFNLKDLHSTLCVNKKINLVMWAGSCCNMRWPFPFGCQMHTLLLSVDRISERMVLQWIFFPGIITFSSYSFFYRVFCGYRSEEFSCCYENSVNKWTLKFTLGVRSRHTSGYLSPAGCVCIAYSSLQE